MIDRAGRSVTVRAFTPGGRDVGGAGPDRTRGCFENFERFDAAPFNVAGFDGIRFDVAHFDVNRIREDGLTANAKKF